MLSAEQVLQSLNVLFDDVLPPGLEPILDNGFTMRPYTGDRPRRCHILFPSEFFGQPLIMFHHSFQDPIDMHFSELALTTLLACDPIDVSRRDWVKFVKHHVSWIKFEGYPTLRLGPGTCYEPRIPAEVYEDITTVCSHTRDFFVRTD